MNKAAFYTLGCKVNQYDTEAVMESFIKSGYEIVEFHEYADVYVVNTCTVTHLSDRKCRQMLRKTKKINPNSILVAMGCYAQAAKDNLKEQIEEVNIVVGTDHRNKIIELVEEYNKQKKQYTNIVTDIMDVYEFEELQVSTMSERTRVYLKIQEGCNNYCAYCIIPYVRGRIRSREIDNIIDEANRLADSGFKEIVLTGIHVASYGKDLNNISLIDVIRRIHDIEGIERIRMSSIEPNLITKYFVETIKSMPKLCHHFHLSLQSGSDSVLKRMNRKYNLDEYRQSVNRLRSIWEDVAITTDIIVGFPGETDSEFNETLSFVQEIAFSQIHIFPFSPREGTPAARMKDQITPTIKTMRAKKLSSLEKKLRKAFLNKHIGKKLHVLFEMYESDMLTGYTSNYLKFQTACTDHLENKICQVIVDKVENNNLIGHIID